MANFWRVVNEVINKSDILIVVADARFPEESINSEILKKIDKKKYMIVFNKIDLLGPVTKKRLNEVSKKFEFSMCVSAKQHCKTMVLLRKLNAIAQGKHVVVGVLGYPNTGKSSIINALKGKNSAPVSPRAGYTHGLQKIVVTEKITLIDTPGVIPYGERNNFDLQILIASKNIEELKDSECVAMRLMEGLDGVVEKYYGVEKQKDLDVTIEKIAMKLNLVKRGNVPDSCRASIRIIKDWQLGKIKL
jgi:ribosome biogenesis GTPase A